MRYLRSIYAVSIQYLRSIYAVFMQYIYSILKYLRSIYAVSMQYLCNIYAYICSIYAVFTQYLCSIYAEALKQGTLRKKNLQNTGWLPIYTKARSLFCALQHYNLLCGALCKTTSSLLNQPYSCSLILLILGLNRLLILAINIRLE
jgi:hypothetical protein